MIDKYKHIFPLDLGLSNVRKCMHTNCGSCEVRIFTGQDFQDLFRICKASAKFHVCKIGVVPAFINSIILPIIGSFV